MSRAQTHFLALDCRGDAVIPKEGGRQMADDIKDSIRRGYVTCHSKLSVFPASWTTSTSGFLTTRALAKEIGSIPEFSPGNQDLGGGRFYSRGRSRVVFSKVGLRMLVKRIKCSGLWRVQRMVRISHATPLNDLIPVGNPGRTVSSAPFSSFQAI
ncbi:hypothetical protein BOTBODRAFT_469765 [Botryobasidium botryosum FD-172 SS1]|uniref:Uncharacterized protein n=1 Tax=Botryobasidium botryosum (strain FD-172 SS1) TaxID=930990 RepID=A0A067M8F3_BOTB1|nr:hypothetical protein BOTBODRAFT_469765 [Botryobasidium botryosum FD-172 SS1]